MRETHKHQRTPGNQTILMGDLNSSWMDSDKGGTHPALHRWANQMGWCNPSRTITDHLQSTKIRTKWTSITPVSWIDHILTFQGPTMPQLLGLHLARSPATISDNHRLFWNSFRIPAPPPKSSTNLPQRTTGVHGRCPISSRTNIPKTNSKSTCKNGSTRTRAPQEPISHLKQPAPTFRTSVKHLLASGA